MGKNTFLTYAPDGHKRIWRIWNREFKKKESNRKNQISIVIYGMFFIDAMLEQRDGTSWP